MHSRSTPYILTRLTHARETHATTLRQNTNLWHVYFSQTGSFVEFNTNTNIVIIV